MTSLPPKPLESPSRDRPDQRYSPDDRDRRPPRSMVLPPGPRYRGLDRFPANDRGYRGGGDSYVASSFDSRRDHELRRRDDDRDRVRDRSRSRSRDRGAWERSRGFTDRDRPRPPSPYRRAPERDRGTDRGKYYPPSERYREPYDRRDLRPYSPPRRDGYRRSRSPPPRRRFSPDPSYRGRAMSRPRSRSRSRSPPPHKRMRLGNHSIDTSPHPSQDHRSSPRPRNPSQPAHERTRTPLRRSRSRSPAHTQREKTPLQASKYEETAHPPNPSSIPITNPAEIPPDHRSPSQPSAPTPVFNEPATVLPPREPLADRQAESLRKETEIETPIEKVDVDVKMRERSPSPPRQPRNRAPPAAPMSHRRTSRSPPRGPRNHPRGNTTPTGPASFHPTGPRSQRRPYVPNAPPTAPASQSIAPSPIVEDHPTPAHHTPTQAESAPAPPTPSASSEMKPPLPVIPPYELPPASDIDQELVRLQSHRAHLASEYISIGKGARRALHEVDLVLIDLRAAEARRKVAASHMEKARAGVLGIDAIPTEAPVV